MTGVNRTSFNQGGFTLMEVLIGLAILSFIMIGVLTVTDTSQETAIRVIKEDRAVLQVETAMSRLDWDVSHAYSPMYFSHPMEPNGLSQNEGEVYNQMVDRFALNNRFAFPSYHGLPVPTNTIEEKVTFTFFTASNRRKFRNVKQSHFAWVRYTLVDPEEVGAEPVEEASEIEGEPQGKVLVRKFLADDVFAPEQIDWEDVKSQVLLRGVDSLVFEFWNPDTKKWTDNLRIIKEGAHRIRGVKVTMDWIDEDGIKRKFIRIFRPLFPESFKAENMYKLIRGASGAGVGNSDQNGEGGDNINNNAGDNQNTDRREEEFR